MTPPRRPKYRAARAFYLTLFIGVCFATFSLFTHRPGQPSAQLTSLHARSLDSPAKAFEDEDACRAVHHAQDQCAFVHAHCPTDEGGFTAYLDLYYCRLSHLRPLAFTALVAWLGMLFSTIGIAASDFFCLDLNTIAAILGMSESMTGVTFLAFGNGSPDVFSTFAAMSTNSGSLAVGELFGAAGFITAVVAGSMALIRPFHVSKKSFIRDVGFFTVAAAFSMIFLWDGKLHFWECATMVGYYIFYVVFVVVWHWWLARRRARREKEAAARGHFLLPGDEDDMQSEPYRDDPDEGPDRPEVQRGASWEDWSALESGGGGPGDNEDEDAEEEARDRWMSELASNMRLTRPNARSRRNTVTPVRPSLVGALEFQAVLKSLQRSRNIQTIPLNSRRYSDDPTFTTLQQQDQMSATSGPADRPAYEVHVTDESSPALAESRDHLLPRTAHAARPRAVSTNDGATLRVQSNFPKLSPIQSEDYLTDTEDSTSQRSSRKRSSSHLDIPAPSTGSHPVSPSVRIEPATPHRPSFLEESRSRASSTTSGDLLAPPGEHFARALSRERSDSPKVSPQLVPRAKELPKIVIPPRNRSRSSSRATSIYSIYRDHPSPAVTASTRSPSSTRAPSLHLPAPVMSPETLPVDEAVESEIPRRPTRLTKIWPYKVLPPPGVLITTLVPTLYHWQEKAWFEKLLGIVATPSVFLLTITLPVVETERNKQNEVPATTPTKATNWDSVRTKSVGPVQTLEPDVAKGIVPEYVLDPESHDHDAATDGLTGLGNTASVAVHTEQDHHNYGANAGRRASVPGNPAVSDDTMVQEADEAIPELWNRWLTIIQLFLAPIFIVFAVYIQAPSDLEPSWLVRPILICLLVSTILLIPLLLTTTPTHRPEVYRIILSMVGFVVSIAWISAVASQVVGALKALAVILNMSHAIMGLTIFAVGNSLGDLVADVTVARLGYPVMALSACIGGPMLNILLGVGLSGSYILIRSAERRHDKHPEKGIRFKTYHIEVSKTLIVSGITLLVTLVGLLIAVPLNKWTLSRRIGWSLIALWTISTVFNVVIEVTGFLGEVER